jgi:hypothetical protein
MLVEEKLPDGTVIAVNAAEPPGEHLLRPRGKRDVHELTRRSTT